MKTLANLLQQAVPAGKGLRSPVDSPPGVGPDSTETIDTAIANSVARVFAQFELAYHNLFHAAFDSEDNIALAMQLWARHLARFDAETIDRAGAHAITHSEYLPTLEKMLRYCQVVSGESPLPDTRDAYVEACHALSPGPQNPWSHPAVYAAGRKTGWHFLATRAESATYPVFVRHYEEVKRQLAEGASFSLPKAGGPVAETGGPAPRTEQSTAAGGQREPLQQFPHKQDPQR